MKLNIINFPYNSFLEEFKIKTLKSDYFARPLYRQVFLEGVFQPEALDCFKKSPKVLEEVKKSFTLKIPLTLKEKISIDKTVKFIFQTEDSHLIESVIIPMKNYFTLCISSQIGCKMQCLFCQTAKMGFKRNLNIDEIIGQLLYIIHIENLKVRNVVFMGMGEPFDNFCNVNASIQILTDTHGLNYKRTHITISTCGLIDGIEKYYELLSGSSALAVSINASNDETRNKLMPINKKYNLESLKKILMKNYNKNSNRRVLIEYLLLDGINDSTSDAENLALFCKGLNVRINLIPYNPIKNSGLKPSSNETYENFAGYLVDAGFHTLARRSKGHSIMAGCGQLGS